MTLFLKYTMDCNHEHPVNTQELELLRNHKFSDSKNTKCLQACVFKKIKWMNNKGMFDDEVAYNTSQKEFTDPSKLEQLKTLYTECKKVNDIIFEGPDSNCERASALAKCLSEHSIKSESLRRRPDFPEFWKADSLPVCDIYRALIGRNCVNKPNMKPINNPGI
ncbi:general odorant-binding protein 19d-like [Aricia agestis]|uniref:general odorant-binding protein 19d-like n=1 Tax=Aricia agestis TaxID=91739 RepID=UPI001C203D73|nr:general odorant-binding protein 19d-like [Aricia agestis]